MPSLMRLIQERDSKLWRSFHRIARWVRWTMLAFVIVLAALAVGCIWLNHWLASASGLKFVTDLIHEQTGAEAQLASIDSALPNHLALHDLLLRMPAKGGAYETRPSIVAHEIQYRLRLETLLYGTFDLQSLTIDGLEVMAERRDGRLWIAGMLEYLEARSKKANEGRPPEPAESPSEPMTLDRLRGMMSKIAVPLRVLIGEVGLKNAVIHFRDFEKNKSVTEFNMGPFHALIGANAWIAKSAVWADIGGDLPEATMMVRIKHQKLSFEKKIASKIRLDLENLHTLHFQTMLKGTPIPLDVNIGLALNDHLDQLDVLALDINAGDILQQRGQGRIKLLDDSLKKFSIHLVDELSVQLGKLNPFIPAKVGISLAGGLRLKKLNVDGDLDLDSLNTLPHLKIPNVDLDLVLDDVSARAKRAALSKFAGSIALKVTASTPKDGGIDVVNNIDLKIASITGSAVSAAGATKALIQNLNLKTGIQVSQATSIEETAIDRLNVLLTADKVAATLPGKPMISVPLKITVEGAGKIAKESGHAQIDALLGSLLTAQVKGQCTAKCDRTMVDVNAVIAKIEDVFELVRPLLPQNAALPELKRGRLEAKIHSDIALPRVSDGDWAKRFKAAKPTVDAKVILKDLGVGLPSQKIQINGINFAFETNGDLKAQRVASNVTIETISMPKLPEPIHKTSFDILATAEKDGVIAVKTFALAIPGVGTALNLTARTELDAEHMPQNLHVDLKLDVDPKAVKAVPKALALSGSSQVTLSVDAPDLSQVQARGNISFEDFGIEVKKIGDNGAEETLIRVDNLRGQLPFQQQVDVKEIMDAKKAAVIAAQASPTPIPDAGSQLDHKLDTYLGKYSSPIGLSGSRMTSEYYGEMRPLYSGRKPITIERIQMKDLKFDNIEIDAELKQQQVSLNQLIIGVLGGKVQAGVQASFDTKLRDVNISAQWTRLDTRKLADNFPKLQERMKGFSILSSSPYIDGTLRLKYDAISGDIAGGMEITSIGKEQLKMILLYLDPDDKNPTLVSIRKALNIGEVRQVSVPIRNGQIGVDVDVRVFSAPFPTPKLQRFPLAQLVRNFTGAGTAVKSDKAKEVDGTKDKPPEKEGAKL